MSVAKQLGDRMRTRATAPTEKHENNVETESIANIGPEIKNKPVAEVTGLPPLPPDDDRLKILDYPLFADIHIQNFTEAEISFPNLETFVSSISDADKVECKKCGRKNVEKH